VVFKYSVKQHSVVKITVSADLIGHNVANIYTVMCHKRSAPEHEKKGVSQFTLIYVLRSAKFFK